MPYACIPMAAWDDVQAPSWSATAERLKAAVDKLKKLAPTTKHVDDLIAHGVLEELKNTLAPSKLLIEA